MRLLQTSPVWNLQKSSRFYRNVRLEWWHSLTLSISLFIIYKFPTSICRNEYVFPEIVHYFHFQKQFILTFIWVIVNLNFTQLLTLAFSTFYANLRFSVFPHLLICYSNLHIFAVVGFSQQSTVNRTTGFFFFQNSFINFLFS